MTNARLDDETMEGLDSIADLDTFPWETMGDDERSESIDLCLYIAGDAPNSVLALKNLRLICEEYLRLGGWRLEVVDVLKEPRRALADRILISPTLVKRGPGPVRQVVGNLSDRQRVVESLYLKPASEG